MHKDAKILIVGHGDAAEKSLVQELEHRGFGNVFASFLIGLDTTIQSSVNRFFSAHKPEHVFLFSVRSGGIQVNQEKLGEFFYANSASQNNVIYAAHKFETKKLIYFASSCVYPKDCPQPMKQDSLTTGPLEPTSEAYAMAKLSGMTLCRSYRAQYGFDAVVVVPATVYGPGCDMNIQTSHVLGSLIDQCYEAKKKNQQEIVLWGTGEPRREFIFSEDFAAACLVIAERYQGHSIVHVGSGSDITIKDLAALVKDISGFSGNIVFDRSKPDGASRKLLDSSLMTTLGWKPQTDLRQGIQKTLDWLKHERIS